MFSAKLNHYKCGVVDNLINFLKTMNDSSSCYITDTIDLIIDHCPFI